MNQLSLSTKAGKVYWASLLGYCITFAAFFFNTQFALGKLDDELRSGSLSSIGATACARMKGCLDITYLPYLVLNKDTNKYIAQVAIAIKNTKNIDQSILLSLLEEKRASLPWYVNQKFDSFDVVMVNGVRKPQAEKRADWYLSLINKLGG